MTSELPFTPKELAIAIGATLVVALGALALGHGHYAAATGALFAMLLGFGNMALGRVSAASGRPGWARVRDWLSVAFFGFAAITLLLAPQL